MRSVVADWRLLLSARLMTKRLQVWVEARLQATYGMAKDRACFKSCCTKHCCSKSQHRPIVSVGFHSGRSCALSHSQMVRLVQQNFWLVLKLRNHLEYNWYDCYSNETGLGKWVWGCWSRFICITDWLNTCHWSTVSFVCKGTVVSHSNTKVMVAVAWPAGLVCHWCLHQLLNFREEIPVQLEGLVSS